MVMPNAKAIAAFTPVLAWLEQGAPHTSSGLGFNMGFFHTGDGGRFDDYASNACGTVCCIAGALTQFSSIEVDRHYPWINQIAGELDLEWSDAYELFLAQEYRHDRNVCLEELTAAHAARTLRTYLETGEVNWAAAETPRS